VAPPPAADRLAEMARAVARTGDGTGELAGGQHGGAPVGRDPAVVLGERDDVGARGSEPLGAQREDRRTRPMQPANAE